jgi:O-antigen ligase
VPKLPPLRSSAAYYLGVLTIGIVLARFAGYLSPTEALLKGQPAIIVAFFCFFGVAAVAWLLLERRAHARGWLLWFLIAMSCVWVVQLWLYRLHGDSFNYTALLFVPILAMVALKPPRASEAWTAVLAFAWTTSAVLVLTRALEMLHVIDLKAQDPNIITFDDARYWLPLNDWLGIDGRWPGPFGHNGDTAMLGALLIVIAVARWTWVSYVFIPVGVFTLLITAGRASEGAAAAGIVVIFMFARSGWPTRIPRRWRVVGGALALLVGALAMYSGKSGLTGRQTIWPAFFDLWQTSPITGVGGSGITVSGGITQQFGHAHSLYLDELARHGLIAFIVLFTALGLGLVIAVRAAGRGAPGPLAVLVAYFVTGVTEPRNNWIEPSVTGFLVTLMVIAAAVELSEARGTNQPYSVSGRSVEAKRPPVNRSTTP